MSQNNVLFTRFYGTAIRSMCLHQFRFDRHIWRRAVFSATTCIPVAGAAHLIGRKSTHDYTGDTDFLAYCKNFEIELRHRTTLTDNIIKFERCCCFAGEQATTDRNSLLRFHLTKFTDTLVFEVGSFKIFAL